MRIIWPSPTSCWRSTGHGRASRTCAASSGITCDRLARGGQLRIDAHAGGVNSVAFMPDGKRLISAGITEPLRRIRPTKDTAGSIRLWDVATGRPIPLQLDGPSDKVAAAALSPDGTRLAASHWRSHDPALGPRHRRPGHAGRAGRSRRLRRALQPRRQAPGLPPPRWRGPFSRRAVFDESLGCFLRQTHHDPRSGPRRPLDASILQPGW